MKPAAEKAEKKPKLVRTGDAVLDAVREAHGEESVILLDGSSMRNDLEKTSSGSLALDYALGGGYPRGRIVEIFGVESSGKTTLALHAIAEIQRLGERGAFVDAEHAIDPTYAEKLGVRLKDLLLSQPNSGEQAIDIVETLAKTGDVSLIVIDSVAALTPQAEQEGDMEQQHMGLHARLMSKAMRKLCAVASQKKCTLLFLNQIRMKIGVLYGNPEVTTGGNALKYYASQRMQCGRREHVKEGELSIGNKILIKVVKNKVAPPFQEAGLTIRWGHGIDRAADLLEAAEAAGVVLKSGAWYSYGGTRLGQGFNTAAKALITSKELRVKVYAETRKALGMAEGGEGGPE